MKRNVYLTVLMLLIVASVTSHASGQTTSVQLVKYAEDGSAMNETTVTYDWMEANLPVHGDGITHYYHQGPVFSEDKWDRNETTNFKDKGAVKGTDIRDLCDMVGGASPDDEVMICASDGYHVEFGYANVYDPDPGQGPIVLCWYDSEKGYPPDYFNGMCIVFLADDHVFGNWDMHEYLPEQSQHFFGDLSPSTNGLSVKWVSGIQVYTGGYAGDHGGPAKSLSTSTATTTPEPDSAPGFETVFAIAGLLLVAAILRRRK
jgi:PGF-CTERM protein